MKGFYVISLTLVGILSLGLMGCEDDVEVTPSNGTTPCTGSYCKLDNNQGENKVAMIANPNLY